MEMSLKCNDMVRFKYTISQKKPPTYSLEKEFLEGTTVHLWWCFNASDIQERWRQIDVQNYVVYSATLYGYFIMTQYWALHFPTFIYS